MCKQCIVLHFGKTIVILYNPLFIIVEAIKLSCFDVEQHYNLPQTL